MKNMARDRGFKALLELSPDLAVFAVTVAINRQ
jgi:hypothetical protein